MTIPAFMTVMGRLLPYWLTVACSIWILAFLYAWTCEVGTNAYSNAIFNPLLASSGNQQMIDWATNLVGFVTPIVIVSCVSALLLTSGRLPAWRVSWFNKIAALVRRHPPESQEGASRNTGCSKFLASLRPPFRSINSNAEYGHDLATKVNQFGRGEADFNAMSIWLVFLPMFLSFAAYMPWALSGSDESAAELGVDPMQVKVETTSYTFGWVSILCLAFFLIPVTKHSVLLAAMGWSPIHALRIHIWFGYLSFIFMMLHGVLLVPVWFLYYDYPVWQQIVPNRTCWTWTKEETTEHDTMDDETMANHTMGNETAENQANVVPDCYHVFANWTGILAAVFYIVLWGSSLNWVRRHNYRLFYILHVTFGTLTLLGTVLHMNWFAIYFIPSFTYYLASTTPTLVQALASRFRGGVKIRKVVKVEDSGGCVEVQVEAHETAGRVLDREPCQFVKICVPTISLVWHPFDVYKSYSEADTSVNFLFRPVGPFTKQLAEHFTCGSKLPVTLVDGFYLGADKTEQALQHDCVTLVAGGVAISPYLTLIPALLRRLASENGGKVKKVALHWSCRERGLCSFIVQNYLSRIAERAGSHNRDVTLSINIYITGGGKQSVEDASGAQTLEGSSRLLLPAPKVESSDEIAMEDTEMAEGSSSGPSDGVENSEQFTSHAKEIDSSATAGHPMELSRMLSRRYSNPAWNFPLFVAFSGSVWFGYWYLLSQNLTFSATSYYEYSEMTWITMYAILMYFAYGIAVEGTVLTFRKFWPQPKGDNFNITTSKSDVEDDDDVVSKVNTAPASKGIDIVYHEGRPTADQIFADARLASEPGIFMCGPPTLTGMVKREARKENSYLGLTRFCLYDEPYEM